MSTHIIHSVLNKYYLSIQYGPGTVLGLSVISRWSWHMKNRQQWYEILQWCAFLWFPNFLFSCFMCVVYICESVFMQILAVYRNMCVSTRAQLCSCVWAPGIMLGIILSGSSTLFIEAQISIKLRPRIYFAR